MIVRYLREHTNPPVFVSAAVLAVGFVLWGVLAPASLGDIASTVNTFITSTFGWFYIFSATAFLIFVVILMAYVFPWMIPGGVIPGVTK